MLLDTPPRLGLRVGLVAEDTGAQGVERAVQGSPLAVWWRPLPQLER